MIPGRVVLELWRRSRGMADSIVCDAGLRRHDTERYLPITCDLCSAHGWLSCGTPQDWPVPCDVCDGRGSLSLHAIAEMLDEDPGALYRLFEIRVRPRTALRLLDKLLAFTTELSIGNPDGSRNA